LRKTINFKRYHDACEIYLKIAIAADAKSDIETITRNYITNLLNYGISKEHLFEINKRVFFDETNPVSSIEKIDEFFALLSPKIHNFDVYFKAKLSIHEIRESNSAFSLRVLDKLPQDVCAPKKYNGFILGNDECYVQISDITATDMIAAYTKAEQRLDMVSDLLAFYSHKKTLEWSQSALVQKKCCEIICMEISRPRNSMSKGRNFKSNFAAARLNTLISDLSLRGGSFRKFNQVVDLHGMALASDVPSNQLLNLWISLETIVPSSRSGKTTINKITNSIMPFILEGYVRRLVVNLTKDLYYWNRRCTGELLNKAPNNGKATMKALQMLSLDECTEIRSSFYSKLTNFPLLRQRIYNLSEKLSTPNKIIHLLGQHQQKVEWQLRRIYRTRNSVVHAGSEPLYTNVLIENCHDYLDIVLNSIIRLSCQDYSASSLDQAFELGQIHYQKFLRELKKLDSFSSTNIGFMVGSK